MSTFLIFVAGLLIGWLIEWVIDWLYWRRVNADLRHQLHDTQSSAAVGRLTSTEIERMRQELDAAKEQAGHYEAEIARLSAANNHTTTDQTDSADIEQCQQELVEAQDQIIRYQSKLKEFDTYHQKLSEAESEIEQLKAELSQRSGQTAHTFERVIIKDNLERINGIGPVFARKLNKANIFTFDQLAALTPENIEEIIAPHPWQHIDPEDWIAEAKEFTEISESSR